MDFADHSQVASSIDGRAAEGQAVLDQITAAGVDLADVFQTSKPKESTSSTAPWTNSSAVSRPPKAPAGALTAARYAKGRGAAGCGFDSRPWPATFVSLWAIWVDLELSTGSWVRDGSVPAGPEADCMTTFTGREDRERVLTEILRQGSAAPGTTTLIAHVDRVTQAVLAVRSMPTPDPIIDGRSHFAEAPILRLSAELRTMAQELAPQPTWTGKGWSAPTSELLTVVCRDGEAAITPVESQFFLGWRSSNHLTSALDGDVYVVTPQGWASLFGEWSGDLPALPTSAPPLACAAAVEDAERILADASSALLDPDRGSVCSVTCIGCCWSSGAMVSCGSPPTTATRVLRGRPGWSAGWDGWVATATARS